jgi:dynactin complex subunit
MQDRLPQAGGHIEQMRELILGPHVRDSSQRFEQCEIALRETGEALRKGLDEVGTSLARQLDNATLALEKKLKALDVRTGEDRISLQRLIEQLDERLTVRLTKLESDLQALRTESRERFDSVNTGLSYALKDAIESTGRRLDALSATSHAELSELHRDAQRTDEKLSLRVQAIAEDLESVTSAIRQELARVDKGARDEVQMLKSQLGGDIDKHHRFVRDTRLSRDDMAEILFEFGMRVKGLSLVTSVPSLPASGSMAESLPPPPAPDGAERAGS